MIVMSLNPDQFGFVEKRSPLDYGVQGVQRIEMTHPDAPEPTEPYYAPTQQKRDRSGRTLKTPKVVPGTDPKAVGFLDYSATDDGPHIHYLSTRGSLRGQRIASRLVDHFYDQHSDAPSVNWGRVVAPEAGRIAERKANEASAPATRWKREYR